MFSSKNILIAADHGGFELKEQLKKYLESKKYNIIDCGAKTLEPKDNYPDYAHKLCGFIKLNKAKKGILICGTGIGMSMAANRHKNIRAALCQDIKMAKLAREHNDANVLVLGGRVINEKKAKEILDVFLKTKFKSGRHKARRDSI